jgi:hypothetical protein
MDKYEKKIIIMIYLFLNDPIWPVLFFNHSFSWFLVGPPNHTSPQTINKLNIL